MIDDAENNTAVASAGSSELKCIDRLQFSSVQFSWFRSLLAYSQSSVCVWRPQGDNARVLYRLIDGETTGSDVVRVNSSSGDVIAARRFERRESAEMLSVCVLAEDQGRPSRTDRKNGVGTGTPPQCRLWTSFKHWLHHYTSRTLLKHWLHYRHIEDVLQEPVPLLSIFTLTTLMTDNQLFHNRCTSVVVTVITSVIADS